MEGATYMLRKEEKNQICSLQKFGNNSDENQYLQKGKGP